jgi:hypothetical protein
MEENQTQQPETIAAQPPVTTPDSNAPIVTDKPTDRSRIDVVYLCMRESRYRHLELRMSLRSLETYCSAIGTVHIVGHCPDWIQNVNHIPVEDEPRNVPDWNIMNKLRVYCEQTTEPFLFVNDDHYFLTWFQAPEFPYFHMGSLEDYVRRRGTGDSYGRRSSNTLQHLKQKGLPTKHFDCHYPIIYDPKKFIETVVKGASWNTHRDGFIIKSLYANSLRIDGIQQKDYKLNEVPPKEAKVFSTYPHIKHSIQRFLTERFPDKSKYEKRGF